MGKLIFKLTATVLITATIITGCRSAAQKRDDAITSEQDVIAVQKANEEIHAKDMKVFQYMADLKIKSNATRIAELKTKIYANAAEPDMLYMKKVYALEQKNNTIKERKKEYDKSQNDWDSFSSEFNNDMDQVTQEVKNLKAESK